MGKFYIKGSIEVYPDGEVIVYSENDTVLHLTRKQVLNRMIENLRGCDWLTISDMEEFANEILKKANAERKRQER